MRFILISNDQKVIENIEMPDNPPIDDNKEIVILGHRYFVFRPTLSTPSEYYFYEVRAYDWVQDIELKRIKH